MGRRKKKNEVLEQGVECAKNTTGGFVFTMVLIFLVPIVTNLLIAPYVSEKVGSTSLGFLTSDMIAAAAMLAVMLLFMLCLGGSAVMARYGPFGILGLILAYGAIGRLYDSAIPVLVVIVVWMYASLRNRKKKSRRRKKR